MTENELCFLTPEQLSALTGVDPAQADMQRLTRLHTIANNPYHKVTLGNLSAKQMVRIVIYGYLEALDFDRAYTAIARLHRMEREEVRDRERAGKAGDPVSPRPPFIPRDPVTGGCVAQPAPAPAPAPAPPRPTCPPSAAARAAIYAEATAGFAECAAALGLTVEEFEADLNGGISSA